MLFFLIYCATSSPLRRMMWRFFRSSLIAGSPEMHLFKVPFAKKTHLLLKKCATCLFIHKKNKKRQKYCFARRKRVNLHVINLFLS